MKKFKCLVRPMAFAFIMSVLMAQVAMVVVFVFFSPFRDIDLATAIVIDITLPALLVGMFVCCIFEGVFDTVEFCEQKVTVSRCGVAVAIYTLTGEEAPTIVRDPWEGDRIELYFAKHSHVRPRRKLRLGYVTLRYSAKRFDAITQFLLHRKTAM